MTVTNPQTTPARIAQEGSRKPIVSQTTFARLLGHFDPAAGASGLEHVASSAVKTTQPVSRARRFPPAPSDFDVIDTISARPAEVQSAAQGQGNATLDCPFLRSDGVALLYRLSV